MIPKQQNIFNATNLIISIISLTDGTALASLSDVLVFGTGASSPPPLGYEKNPELSFVNGDFPKANTCAGTLYIPLDHEEYDVFKEKMDVAMLNTPCFGYA